MPEIEIFRAGTHVAESGATVTITEADVVACAAAYDAKAHEAPVCVGHPKTDAPAFGWVKGLTAKGPSLYAEVDQVEPQFAGMVKRGLFKKVSAAFFPPAHPANPKPGAWSLRHLGFLGAAPPSVMGLKPVQFSGGEDGVVAFAALDITPWTFGRIASLFSSIRAFFLSEFGQEKADAALSAWDVDQLLKDAGRLEAQDAPAFAQPQTRETSLTDPTKTPPTAAELEQREKRVQEQEVAFAASQKTQRLAVAGSFVDRLVTEGRVLPAQKAGLVAVLGEVSAIETVAFAAADGAEVKQSPYELLTKILAAVPPQVPLGQVVKPGAMETAIVAFAAPEGFQVDTGRLELHQSAIAYQAAHPNTDYVAAVKAVGGA